MPSWEDLIERVLLAETSDLRALAKIANSDPKSFYRDASFRKAQLNPEEIAGLDLEFATYLRPETLNDENTDYIAGLREILYGMSRTNAPLKWASTQYELGNALYELGARIGGEDGARLLVEAVDAYRAALRIYTEAAHPVDWARTQNNLGTALQEQGIRTGGADGARLLGEALDAYRAALRVTTEAAHPVDWAATQNNLAVALVEQGIRTDGAEGARLLGEAVAAYRAALRVRTKAAHPVDWAMTRKNMAYAEEGLADHDTTTDPRPHLDAALDHVEAALTVYDPEHMSFNHDTATYLRDRLRASRTALDTPG